MKDTQSSNVIKSKNHGKCQKQIVVCANTVNDINCPPTAMSVEKGCQCKLRNEYRFCSCRKHHKFDKRYYFNSPKHVYGFYGTKSITDIGVSNVKTLHKRRVKRVHLPETKDTGTGNSCAYPPSKRIKLYVETGVGVDSVYSHSKVDLRSFRHEKYTLKSNGSHVGNIQISLINKKLSPIIKTKSESTSPDPLVIFLPKENFVDDMVNKKPIGNIEYLLPYIDLNKQERDERQNIKQNAFTKTISNQNSKEIFAMIITRPKDNISKRPAEVRSSVSLVQCVHNFEIPNNNKKSKTSLDLTDNNLEREYRKTFAVDSKTKDDTDNPNLNTVSFKQRIEALRSNVRNKDFLKYDEEIRKSSQTSVRSRKDVSITSDPPSLEEKSLTDIKKFSPYNSTPVSVSKTKTTNQKSILSNKCQDSCYKTSEDEEFKGAKGMFNLWEREFNLQGDNKKIIVNDKKINDNIADNNSRRKEILQTEIKKECKEDKKKGRKFFFFKKKRKDKETNPYKNHKSFMTGRCEVGDGLMITIGASKDPKFNKKTQEPTSNGNVVRNQQIFQKYEDLRKSWLRKYVANMMDSRDNVYVRWNNSKFTTSSTTCFELKENIFKSAGIVIRSRSEIWKDAPTYSYANRHVNYVRQEIDTWMIPKITLDQPIKSASPDKSCHNIEVKISKQKRNVNRWVKQIKIVLHSENILRLSQSRSSSFLTIDIPKGFFDESFEKYQCESNQSSDEEVYNIVDYDTLQSNTAIKVKKFDAGDNMVNQLNVSVYVKDEPESEIIQTASQSLVKRDFAVQVGSCYIRNDVIGFLNKKHLRRLKNTFIASKDSDQNLAEIYIREYFRELEPIRMNLFSSCVSDSHLQCYSSQSINSNQSVVTSNSYILSRSSSCSNRYFRPIISIQNTENASCSWKLMKKIKTLMGSEHDNNLMKRILPKESIQVFKKRLLYSFKNSKAQWKCMPDPSNSHSCHEDRKVCHKGRKRVSMCDGKKKCTNTKGLSKKQVGGILIYKGGSACDLCKKSNGPCSKHAEFNPVPREIKFPVCRNPDICKYKAKCECNKEEKLEKMCFAKANSSECKCANCRFKSDSSCSLKKPRKSNSQCQMPSIIKIEIRPKCADPLPNPCTVPNVKLSDCEIEKEVSPTCTIKDLPVKINSASKICSESTLPTACAAPPTAQCESSYTCASEKKVCSSDSNTKNNVPKVCSKPILPTACAAPPPVKCESSHTCASEKKVCGSDSNTKNNDPEVCPKPILPTACAAPPPVKCESSHTCASQKKICGSDSNTKNNDPKVCSKPILPTACAAPPPVKCESSHTCASEKKVCSSDSKTKNNDPKICSKPVLPTACAAPPPVKCESSHTCASEKKVCTSDSNTKNNENKSNECNKNKINSEYPWPVDNKNSGHACNESNQDKLNKELLASKISNDIIKPSIEMVKKSPFKCFEPNQLQNVDSKTQCPQEIVEVKPVCGSPLSSFSHVTDPTTCKSDQNANNSSQPMPQEHICGVPTQPIEKPSVCNQKVQLKETGQNTDSTSKSIKKIVCEVKIQTQSVDCLLDSNIGSNKTCQNKACMSNLNSQQNTHKLICLEPPDLECDSCYYTPQKCLIIPNRFNSEVKQENSGCNKMKNEHQPSCLPLASCDPCMQTEPECSACKPLHLNLQEKSCLAKPLQCKSCIEKIPTKCSPVASNNKKCSFCKATLLATCEQQNPLNKLEDITFPSSQESCYCHENSFDSIDQDPSLLLENKASKNCANPPSLETASSPINCPICKKKLQSLQNMSSVDKYSCSNKKNKEDSQLYPSKTLCSRCKNKPRRSLLPEISESDTHTTGLHLKKNPQLNHRAYEGVSSAGTVHESNCGENLIRLNSRETIRIKTKKLTPSTEEIRENVNFKVKDEDGNTLFERRDYKNKRNDTSILSDACRGSNIHRLSTNNISNVLNDQNIYNQDEIAAISEPNIEINFQIKVGQDDKTTDVSINKRQNEKNNNINSAVNKNVYVLKKHDSLASSKFNDSNDINIKILIKDLKPKPSQNVNLTDTEYSIQRATVKLSSADKESKTMIKNTDENNKIEDENIFSANTVDSKYFIDHLSSTKTIRSIEKSDSSNKNSNNSPISVLSETNIDTSKVDYVLSEPNLTKSEILFEKKELMKELCETANRLHKKGKEKQRLRELKTILKMILTSDSSDPEDAAPMKETAETTSLNPENCSDTNVMNNIMKQFYNADNSHIDKSPSQVDKEKTADDRKFERRNSCQSNPGRNCMCNTSAGKLNNSFLTGGCCCNIKSKLTTIVDSVNNKASFDIKYFDADTQMSRHVANKSNSVQRRKYTRSSKATKQLRNYESKPDGESEYKVSDIATLTSNDTCKMKKTNKVIVLEVEDENVFVGESIIQKNVTVSKIPRSKTKAIQVKSNVTASADWLQSSAAKKAVLEIYAKKSSRGSDQHYVAKLPKFLFREASNFTDNYKEIAYNNTSDLNDTIL